MINVKEMLLGTITNLRNIVRYSNMRRLHNESVAEHSYYVALYTLIIANSLKNHGETLDMAKALGMALAHDLEEGFSGDIINPFKCCSANLQSEIHGTAAPMIIEMANRMKVPELYHLWNPIPPSKYNSGEVSIDKTEYQYGVDSREISTEALVVKFADYLSSVSYVLQELMMGNRSVIDRIVRLEDKAKVFYKSRIETIKDMSAWVLRILSDTRTKGIDHVIQHQ